MTPIRILPPLPNGVRPQPDDITITAPIKSPAHRFLSKVMRVQGTVPMRLVVGDHAGKWFISYGPQMPTTADDPFVRVTLSFNGMIE